MNVFTNERQGVLKIRKGQYGHIIPCLADGSPLSGVLDMSINQKFSDRMEITLTVHVSGWFEEDNDRQPTPRR